MKYKVGDKFLQEIEVIRIVEDDQCPYKMLPDGGEWSEAALDNLRRPDDMTVEEAWEIAKKIFLYPKDGGFNATELEEIFGRTEHLWELPPQEVKAKIEAWEAEKKIKVGDVVKTKESTKAVVIETYRQYIDVWTESGYVEKWHKDKAIKTGKQINIQGLLEQIGGAE